MPTERQHAALDHFRRRSRRYDASSRWVADSGLLGKIFAASSIRGGETVLDVATGTGLVAKRFRGRVREVIGLDLSPDMTRRTTGNVDRLLLAPLEAIPLESSSIDVCVCRQGLQFVELPKALAEIRRVLKPGGLAVFCHLAAYGEDDAPDAFKIQALRNPARANFFKPGDLEAAAAGAGLEVLETLRHVSRESVNRWIDHGAIDAARRRAIRDAYRAASPAFKRLHKVEEDAGDVLDSMLFLILRARKPRR